MILVNKGRKDKRFDTDRLQDTLRKYVFDVTSGQRKYVFDVTSTGQRKYVFDVTSAGQRSSTWLKVEIKFPLECSSVFLLHNLRCGKCIEPTYQYVSRRSIEVLERAVKTTLKWLQIEVTARQGSGFPRSPSARLLLWFPGVSPQELGEFADVGDITIVLW